MWCRVGGKIVRDTHGVAHTLGIPGQSFVLRTVGSNRGSMFVILDDFHHRRGASLSADAIAMELRKKLPVEIIAAQIAVFGAPPVDGHSSAGGFKRMVEDRSDVGLTALQGRADQLAVRGMAQPGIAGMFISRRANTPQLFIDVDRTKCEAFRFTWRMPAARSFTVSPRGSACRPSPTSPNAREPMSSRSVPCQWPAHRAVPWSRKSLPV